jgi:hypothetical protein
VTSAEYVNVVVLPAPAAAVTVVMFDAVADDSSPCGWPVPDTEDVRRVLEHADPLTELAGEERVERERRVLNELLGHDDLRRALFAPSVT